MVYYLGMAKEKHAGGRPPKYKKEYAEQARKICKLGATDVQLGDIFGVSEATIYNWKNKYPEFLEAVGAGKLTPLENVELSLYKSCIGYSHKEDKIFNNQGEPLIVPTIKHYPPNVSAIQLYLTNVKPEAWKMKQEVSHVVDPSVIEELRGKYENK
jgi:hypothetical protein